MYPESNTATTRSAIDVTVPIMNVFEEKVGFYPYRSEQYGHVQFGWGGEWNIHKCLQWEVGVEA